MGRLRVCSGREVCRILARFGFEPIRQRGSHIVLQRRTPSGTVTVPIPDHAEIKVGTLLAILRQTGVSRSAFEA